MTQQIVIRCSDGLKNQVIATHHPNDFTIANPGGIKWFLLENRMEQLLEQIKIGIDLKQATRLTIVSHQPCGLYRELGQDKYARYVNDLQQARQLVKQQFANLSIALLSLDHSKNNQLVKID